MKDECAGTPIAEYIGLCPKLYSVLRADEQIIKKAKGVKKYVINKQIKKQVSMIRKYHNHILQTNPGHHKEEPQIINSNHTFLRQEVIIKATSFKMIAKRE